MIADVLPQLVASRKGKRKAQEGLAIQGEFIRGLGVEPGSAIFGSGAGGSITDHTSPKAALKLLRSMAAHPLGAVYRDGLPILGVDGTLSDAVGPDSAVRGKVQAKTGTAVMQSFSDGSFITLSKALAGYMTAASGRELVVAMFVNLVPVPTLREVMGQGQVLGKICEVLFQSL
jgi:D-alanyl-D-alanine carboxypeptidase/D-alanyl-D-alanine-endopeptidase (penicillin-binding protein 4)